jgi:hypothetical protein
MWSILKAILLKLGVLRGLIAVLGSLAAVLPIALALIKLLGWPLLVVLFVLALPLLLVLALVGFPLLAVLAIAGSVLGIAFAVITMGIAAAKFVLFVVLPIWLAWKVAKWAFGWGKGGGRRTPEAAEEGTA